MTAAARRQTLIEIGMLPADAVQIVTNADAQTNISDAQLTALAAVTSEDVSHAAAFVLFTQLVPDWMRGLWSALNFDVRVP